LSSTGEDDVAALAARLTAAFEAIHRERMAGLPILHPGLAVAVVDGRRWQGHWLGVLVTPWCMNLVLVPAPGSALAAGGPGASRLLDLPAGRFELLVSGLDGVGTIAACSLCSPMHAFADQVAAEATAAAVMVSLFEPAADAPAAAAPADQAATRVDCQPRSGAVDSGLPPRRGISRRDLLRGSFRADRA
jgi:[NiFe] hydrogenase assembly HybE family chaperone